MAKRLVIAVLAALAWVSVSALPAQATFTGDNGRIAFRRFLDEERSTGAVFTINPDGTDERQITHPPAGFVDRNPDVSPDGRRIAFEREGEHYDEIFVVNVNGSRLTQLRRNAPGEVCEFGGTCSGSPAWSPTGRQIAFRRASGLIQDDLIENQGIFVMNADGSRIRQVTQKARPALGEDTDPQWSPDGGQLVFQRNSVRTATPSDGVALWTITLATGCEKRITPWDLRAGDTPDWSPDGRRILFRSNFDYLENVSANLYTIRPNGTQLQQLTFEQGGTVNYLGSSYSPDGKMITMGRRPATGGTNADVFVMRADGSSNIRPVTATVLYDSYPDWGPAPRGRHR